MMRILVVKLTSLGDVIHTLPAITDAAKKISGLEIHWLIEENFQAIPALHPSVSNVFTAATRRWRKQPGKFFAEIASLKRQLKLHDYDLIIDAQGLMKSSTLGRYARGKLIGYDKQSIKEPLASRLYDERISVDKNEHAVTRTRKLFAQALGYNINDQINYGITRNHHPPDIDGGYLVYLHGTTWQSKQWPDQYWQQLADMAELNNYKVKLLWGNKSEHDRAQIIAQNKPNTTVCPQMNLDQIVGFLSQAAGVVAVDTGLGHLTAALSVPCINLYGATDSLRTGTIGGSQKHLQAIFECSPCLKKDCSYKGVSNVSPACFEQFSPQMVWQNLERLLRREN